MRHLKSFMLVCMTLIGTLSASAQYAFTIDQKPFSSYQSVSYDYSLEEICQALDTDVATFVADFNANTWKTNYITLASDNNSINYTQGSHGGYWMTADGRAISWSESSDSECIFCVLPYADDENGYFSFYFWQIPNKAKIGDTFHCVIQLDYNGKTLTFDITVNVKEPEIVDVVPYLSQLNILGTVEVTTEQEPRTNWTPDKVEFDLSKAVKDLGFTDLELLRKNFSDYLYMGWYNSNDEAKEDELRNTWTANSGFWTGPFYDSTVGKETDELVNNVPTSSWKVYIEAFNFKTDTQILTANVGQQPNVLKYGESYYIPMYIIKGNNAYILKVNFKVKEEDPDQKPLPFAEQTNVGSHDYEVTINPNNGYKTWPVQVDIATIVELIGEDKSNIKLRALESDGVITTNTTANNGGYWINEEGFVVSYGSGSAFTSIEPSADLSILYIGQMPNSGEIGQVRKFTLYYVGKRAHYQLNFTVHVEEQKSIDLSGYQLVAEEMLEFQMMPLDDYADEHMAKGIDLGKEKLLELLGEGDYWFLGEELNDAGDVLISDNYTCDPSPAFWMEDGYIHSYGGNNCYGILYNKTAQNFHFVQFPGHNKVGDNFTSHFWLVNKETKKMIKYNIYVEYVDDVKEYEVVGQTSIALPLWNELEDYMETPYDITAMLELLGCTEEEMFENGTWKVMNKDGRFSASTYTDEMYGFWFDADGNPTLVEDDQLYCVEFLFASQADNGQNCFRSWAFEEGTYKAVMCAEYDGKRYVFNITIGNGAIPGDVNEDGKVDINDVVAIINHMAGTASWINANVNDDPDGNVDINDVVAVINIMAGK